MIGNKVLTLLSDGNKLLFEASGIRIVEMLEGAPHLAVKNANTGVFCDTEDGIDIYRIQDKTKDFFKKVKVATGRNEKNDFYKFRTFSEVKMLPAEGGDNPKPERLSIGEHLMNFYLAKTPMTSLGKVEEVDIIQVGKNGVETEKKVTRIWFKLHHPKQQPYVRAIYTSMDFDEVIAVLTPDENEGPTP